jgi:putative PIN family toxin of toxin-antitoxin system
LRVVLDPNALVSAALSDLGPSSQLLRAARAGRFELVVCPTLLRELGHVLARPRLRRYLSVDEAIRYLEGVSRLATLADDPPQSSPRSRDPNDDYLLALTDSCGADLLVSGDKDLTELNLPFVVTPREALERLSVEP